MLAIQALGFIAGDPERLARFLAITGIRPGRDPRRRAPSPAFSPACSTISLGDETLLIAFAASAGIDPAEIARARADARRRWERDMP